MKAIADIATITIKKGDIPDSLKITWVTPIWKGKCKDDPADYRPISITNHIMKVVERVVRTQLVDHLDMLGILDHQQHGARLFRSTVSQLIDQNDWIFDSLCEGSNMELLYLDFAKAFDLVDKSLLLTKLRKAKITGNLLLWIRSFLNNRNQCVRVCNSLSTSRTVRSGVP